MRISIISDSHDSWHDLERAVVISNEMNCDILLFAGDLMSPAGISILEKFNGAVKLVWGNNDGEKVKLTRMIDASQTVELGNDINGEIYEGEIDGLKIFMNHYPKVSELAAKSGDYDLVIHGHTHEFREETINDTLLINPGSVRSTKKKEGSFIVYDTTEEEVMEIEL